MCLLFDSLARYPLFSCWIYGWAKTHIRLPNVQYHYQTVEKEASTTLMILSHNVIVLKTEFVGTSTDQEWVLRIGTGLTFLVRFFYSSSLGVILVQLFLGSFQNMSGTTIGTTYRVFEIRTSPAALFDLSFWAFSPMTASTFNSRNCTFFYNNHPWEELGRTRTSIRIS